MRAILLAAGLGTRLRPMTNTIPKCLVTIHGKPLLQIWLERLIDAGVGSFLINTHYLSEQVETFVEKSEFRDHIELICEPELLGTAGTLIRNSDFFKGEDGLLIHADNYCLSDLNAFINAHQRRPERCEMTMMTFRADEPSSCGIVKLDDDGVVTEFYEKIETPPGNVANGAVYILSSELINTINVDFSDVFDFSTEVLPYLSQKIYTYMSSDIFIDIGTVEKYRLANSLC
jgi:mannose-1-phosphate guanylyltransferase